MRACEHYVHVMDRLWLGLRAYGGCRALEAQLAAAEQKLATYRDKLQALDASLVEADDDESGAAAASGSAKDAVAAKQRAEAEASYLTSLVVKVRPRAATRASHASTRGGVQSESARR